MIHHAKRLHNAMLKLALCCILLLTSPLGMADIVKPALVEISVFTSGSYRIEVRASIEALLTGINSQYKNTTEAPNSDQYDTLRVLPSDELASEFASFQQQFIESISLSLDQQPASMKITDVQIPEPGYTKVPRISLIVLEGDIERTVQSLVWYYPARFGDNAVRVRQVDEANEKWHWSQWQWLRRDQPSDSFSLAEVFTAPSIGSVISTYTLAGFEHILPKGLDHILFIVGMMLLGEGGHLAHLTLFGHKVEQMAKSTFYFTIAVLVAVDVVQSRYRKKLMAQRELETQGQVV